MWDSNHQSSCPRQNDRQSLVRSSMAWAKFVQLVITTARASRPGSAVGILRVLCNGMCTAKNSTLTKKNKLAEWDALMSQIVSRTTTSALSSLIFCHNVEERTQILY